MFFDIMEKKSYYLSKIIYFGLIFFILSVNLISVYFLPLESLKYLFLINFILSVFVFFKLFGLYLYPIFIFIGTLTLFQGGLILYSIFHNIDLSFVWLMGANFFASESTVRTSILSIILSYWFLLLGGYIGSINNKKRDINKSKLKTEIMKNKIIKNLALLIFFLSLPLYIYKISIYFNFFLEYSYLAFYQSTEFAERVGFIIRVITFFTPLSFLVYFLLEEKKINILIITFIFFFVSLPLLLSGFRGLFFTFWLTVFLFYKKKFNNNLSFKSLLILVSIISVLGLLVSLYRENVNNINLNILFGKNPFLEFIGQQGVSFFVTVMATEFRDEFKDNILYYLIWEPISAIFPNALNTSGRAFATDLMIKINYEGFLMGYGTGSSYLAESYLLGGVFGVALVSFLIGFILSKLFYYFDYVDIYKKVLIFTAIQYIIYLPRDLLLMPLSQVIKSGIYMLLLYFIFNFIWQILIYKKKEKI